MCLKEALGRARLAVLPILPSSHRRSVRTSETDAHATEAHLRLLNCRSKPLQGLLERNVTVSLDLNLVAGLNQRV